MINTRVFGVLVGIVVPACFYQPSGSEPAETSDTSAAETTANAASSSADPSTSITGAPTACGDGVLDADEECDDGDEDESDECTNDCTIARCGDGVVGPGEACDDGDQEDNDACSNLCVLPTCGDGVVQVGEDCDTSGESAACNSNCKTPACGDLVVNLSAGEECDVGGESDACDVDCTLAACGDGVHNPSAGEGCDDGNVAAGDRCSATCASTEIVDIAAGEYHVCIAFATGAVRCWGRGLYGALGQGGADGLGDGPGELPVPDVDVGGKVVQLSSSFQSTCVRLDDGAVRCWGYNEHGQLGYGGVDPLGDGPGELPRPDVALGAEALDVAHGEQHTCVVVAGGAVRCWGLGHNGQLGYEADTDISPPDGFDVPGLVGIKQLTLGSAHSCALRQDGGVQCWGYNAKGQLGLGHNLNVGSGPGQMPPPIVQPGGPVAGIAAGRSHTCVVREDGAVLCWGDGADGKLGTGSTSDIGDEPGEAATAVDLGGPAKQVVAGGEHTCALMVGGEVKCWGHGVFGRLGYGNTGTIDTADEFPPPNVDLGGDAVLLASHMGDFTCALLVDGTLRCWGNNAAGQLGYGHTASIGDDETPASAGPVPF